MLMKRNNLSHANSLSMNKLKEGEQLVSIFLVYLPINLYFVPFFSLLLFQEIIRVHNDIHMSE